MEENPYKAPETTDAVHQQDENPKAKRTRFGLILLLALCGLLLLLSWGMVIADSQVRVYYVIAVVINWIAVLRVQDKFKL